MIYHFYSRKGTGQIVMYGGEQISAPDLEHHVFDISLDDVTHIGQNWIPLVKGGQLVITPPESEALSPTVVEQLKDKVNKAQNFDDLKEVLNNILNNL